MRASTGTLSSFVAANNVAWRADLVTITLLDGTILRWCTADVDLISGGNTFLAGPILGKSNRQNCRLEVDTYDLRLAGSFLISGVTLAKRATQRYFYGARLQVDAVAGPGSSPGDLTTGMVSSWFEGRVSVVDPTADEVRLTARNDLDLLSQVVLPKFLFQPACGHAVYDPNCGLNKATFTVNGTVTNTPSPTASAFGSNLTQIQQYFFLGVVTFTSGSLNGQKVGVRNFDHTNGVITVSLPLPNAPANGDTFTIYPGCTRTLLGTVVSCNTPFANSAKFRGFPHIPAPGSNQ